MHSPQIKISLRSIVLCAVLMLPGVYMSGQVISSSKDSTALVLTLQECITIASGENVNVKNANLDYLSARMLKKEAFTHYFPSVSMMAGGFHALNPLLKLGTSDILGTSDMAMNLNYYIETVAPMLGIKPYYEALGNAYMTFVNLTQPVFAGGRIVNSNKLASLGVEAASLNESIAKRDVVTDIEKKYLLVVSLEEKMKVVESGIALTDSLYKDAFSARASGLMTQSELESVSLARHDLKAKRIKLKGGIMLARMDLCNAMGLKSSEALNLSLSDRFDTCLSPEQYYQDPAALVYSMEEARLLGLAVEQKQLEKKLAMGEALPQLAVGAAYGYGKFIGSTQRQNGLVYATLKIPLTDWSVAGVKMKSIEYQLQKADNQREYLSSMLELQLRQLWVEVESAWEELQLNNEKVEHSRHLLEISSKNLSVGMETMSSYMQKQVDLNTALCDRVDASIAYRNAVAAFVARSGVNNK